MIHATHTRGFAYALQHIILTHCTHVTPRVFVVVGSFIACFAEGLLGVYATANFAKVRPLILPSVLVSVIRLG